MRALIIDRITARLTSGAAPIIVSATLLLGATNAQAANCPAAGKFSTTGKYHGCNCPAGEQKHDSGPFNITGECVPKRPPHVNPPPIHAPAPPHVQPPPSPQAKMQAAKQVAEEFRAQGGTLALRAYLEQRVHAYAATLRDEEPGLEPPTVDPIPVIVGLPIAIWHSLAQGLVSAAASYVIELAVDKGVEYINSVIPYVGSTGDPGQGNVPAGDANGPSSAPAGDTGNSAGPGGDTGNSASPGGGGNSDDEHQDSRRRHR
ncbi:MAG: hypothetical protein ACLQVI_07295 [Polyangiaceae bacterium]